MRIIGKLVVILSGFVVGVSVLFITLLFISSDTTLLIFLLIPLFILYLIGWLASIFVSKQRLLFISSAIYIIYFVYEVGVVTLYQQLTQFTLTIALILLMYMGMVLSKKKTKNHT